MKRLLQFLGIVFVAIVGVYWFQLDEKMLEKAEPYYRGFVAKLHS